MPNVAYTIEGRPVGHAREGDFSGNGNGLLHVCDELPLDLFSLQVSFVSGTVTTWTVTLEGMVNDLNWGTLIVHDNTTPGIGKIIVPTLRIPVKQVRVLIEDLTGTNPVINVAWIGRTFI